MVLYTIFIILKLPKTGKLHTNAASTNGKIQQPSTACPGMPPPYEQADTS